MTGASPSIEPPNRILSGLFRVFPFETRNWRQTIARSGLPDDVQGLIRTVVKKSHLMRFEKIEVVQELIAHFQDGEISGKNCQQMIANFGDPITIAKLIHRSKTRNRPIMFKIAQIFGWFVLAIASAYLMILGYFHSGKPTPTTDYLAEFNQSVRDTDDNDKAWPIYRPMWIKYGFSEGGGFHKKMEPLFFHGTERRNRELLRQGQPGWPEAVAQLKNMSDLLDSFRAGRYKSKLGVEMHPNASGYSPEDFKALFPSVAADDFGAGTWLLGENADDEVKELLNGSTVSILLPHIQSFRNAARIFTVDTRWAVEQNNSERALQNIETVMGLARQAADSNTLIGTLVGFAVAGIGFNSLEEVLVANSDFFDEQQLAQLQNNIENMSIRDWINIDGERAFIMDTIQRVYTDDGNGGGRMTSDGLRFLEYASTSMHSNISNAMPEFENAIRVARHIAEPVSMFVTASRKETTENAVKFFDDYEALFDTPFWEPGDLKTEIEEIENFLDEHHIRYLILARMLPAFTQVWRAMIRTQGRQEGVIAAIAMHRYHLKYGQWPESFDQLSPGFVVEFPVDQINGEFLKFSGDEAGPLIYSVGNNRNDDGGVPIINKYGDLSSVAGFMPSAKISSGRGDWILWPQSRFQGKKQTKTTACPNCPNDE